MRDLSVCEGIAALCMSATVQENTNKSEKTTKLLSNDGHIYMYRKIHIVCELTHMCSTCNLSPKGLLSNIFLSVH